MKKETLMTEHQFIEKFKRKGFELYKTKNIKKKLDALDKAHKIISDVLRPIPVQ